MADNAVLVVGAGPRLGAAIARALATDPRLGTRPVALIGHSEGGTAAVADTLRAEGIEAASAAADVTDAAGLAAAIDRLVGEVGAIDIAVHNVSAWRDAGATATTSAAGLTAADLLADVAVGTASLMSIVGAVAPGMVARGRGVILATGSAAADHPSAGAPSLAVQKAGLRVLVRGLAAELSGAGVHAATVTINGVLGEPGFDVADIAPTYADLAAETDPATWRTVVEYHGS